MVLCGKLWTMLIEKSMTSIYSVILLENQLTTPISNLRQWKKSSGMIHFLSFVFFVERHWHTLYRLYFTLYSFWIDILLHLMLCIFRTTLTATWWCVVSCAGIKFNLKSKKFTKILLASSNEHETSIKNRQSRIFTMVTMANLSSLTGKTCMITCN